MGCDAPAQAELLGGRDCWGGGPAMFNPSFSRPGELFLAFPNRQGLAHSQATMSVVSRSSVQMLSSKDDLGQPVCHSVPSCVHQQAAGV